VIESELFAFCKERLAAYKYRRMVDTVDEVLTTVTDKILRRELLPAPNPS
jgi:long-chain acyl-CoA synthetase